MKLNSILIEKIFILGWNQNYRIIVYILNRQLGGNYDKEKKKSIKVVKNKGEEKF